MPIISCSVNGSDIQIVIGSFLHLAHHIIYCMYLRQILWMAMKGEERGVTLREQQQWDIYKKR